MESTRNTESNDRVRRNTSDDVNREIDRQAAVRVREYSEGDGRDISRRIDDLEREWDIERVLETNAAAIGLTGLALGVTIDRKWLALPGVVLAFLMQHAVQIRAERPSR